MEQAGQLPEETFRLGKVVNRDLFTGKSYADIQIRLSGKSVLSDYRFSLIGGDDDLLVIRDHPQKINSEDLRDVLY